MLRAVSWWMLALLCVSPLAAAGAPFSASVVFDKPPRIDGTVRLADATGLLDLSGDAAVLRIGFDAARGYEVLRTRDVYETPVLHVSPQLPESDRRELRYGAGALDSFACGEGCEILLFGLGSGGEVGIEGTTSDALAWTNEERVHAAGMAHSTSGFTRVAPPGSWIAGAGDGLRLVDPRPYADGRVGLLLWNVSGAITTVDGNREAFETGARREEAFGATVFSAKESRAVLRVLHLDGARVESAGASLAVLEAANASIHVNGGLSGEGATGWLTAADRRELHHAAFALRGVFTIAPSLEDPGAFVLGTKRVRATIEGDAQLIRVAGVVVADHDPLVTAATVAALVGALLWGARSALAFLYSRVARASVLAHPRRAALYEIVGQRPGLTLADLTRAAGLARPVVRHHLRLLVAHGFIVMKREGREIFLFPPAAGRPSLQRLSALRDPTRRTILSALQGSSRPLTQSEVAAATGCSVRLVSHHVAKLAATGLVRHDEGFPRRYSALDTAGADPDANAN